MVTRVQNYVKDLNDHVRFLDSGAISAKANNARKPEVMERLIQSILASPMGVQQQQETTGDAVIAGIAHDQGGADVGTATGANGMQLWQQLQSQVNFYLLGGSLNYLHSYVMAVLFYWGRMQERASVIQLQMM